MSARLVVLLLVLVGVCAARPLGNEPLRGQRVLQEDAADTISEASTPQGIGEAITDQYILFMEDTEDFEAAVQSLNEQVQQVLLEDARNEKDVTVESASASSPRFQVLSTINTATSVTAAAAGGSGSSGVQAVVVKAKPAVMDAINKMKGLVKFSIPDVKAFAAAVSPACVEAAAVGMPVHALKVRQSFTWTGCLSATTKLMYYSRACGDNQLQYTTMMAVDRTTGDIATNRKKPCILYADPNGKPAWSKHRFGGCGKAPAIAPTLPVQVCSQSTPNSPPLGPKGDLPRRKVAAGEEVPTGVARIEAVTRYGAVDTDGQRLGVAVADSGIDCSHPDLNCAGSKSWVQASDQFPEDAAGDKDFYGHGTHVAGIIAAKNNGAGVVGVAPGLSLYSLKVLNGAGSGSTSSWLGAIDWMLNEGASKGVRIINFSLTSYFDPANPSYDSMIYSGLCKIFQQASDAGIIVTAAAGNSGANMRGFFPASCPTVMAVTAVDAKGVGPSVISNWLPANSMTAEERASIIAAPGTSIKSTVPKRISSSGYMPLSGTSMAAPHVAGIAADCLMSGACRPNNNGIDSIAVLQDQARQRYAVPPAYGFAGDATSTANNKYFGYLAWAKP